MYCKNKRKILGIKQEKQQNEGRKKLGIVKKKNNVMNVDAKNTTRIIGRIMHCKKIRKQCNADSKKIQGVKK